MKRRNGGWFRMWSLFGAAGMACVLANTSQAQDDRDLASLSATVGRPLFSRTRRPSPPPVVVAAPIQGPESAPETPPPTFRLTGIVIGDTEEIAIVQRDQGSQPTKLRVDSIVDGWTVLEIRPREIVLAHEDHLITVRLADPATGSKISVRPDN